MSADTFNIANKPKGRITWNALQCASIFTRQTNSHISVRVYCADNLRIHLSIENHLHHFHGGSICDAQAVCE